MLEKRGHDEEYWHWEEGGGGERGATLIDDELRRDRRGAEQRWRRGTRQKVKI